MRFLRPDLAWWLFGAIVVVALARWRMRGRYRAATTVSRLARGIHRASLIRRLPLAVLAVALGLIALALMEPVLPSSDIEVQSRGLDIVMLLDLSSSMQEQMERVRPSRDLSRLTFTTRDSLTLHVEPRRPGRLPPLPTDEPSASPGSAGSQGNWLWLL